MKRLDNIIGKTISQAREAFNGDRVIITFTDGSKALFTSLGSDSYLNFQEIDKRRQ